MKHFCLVLIAVLAIKIPLPASNPTVAEIPFYSAVLYLEYDPSQEITWNGQADVYGIRNFANQMEKVGYHDFLTQLEHFRLQNRLNDWLYFELVRSSVQKVYGAKSRNFKVLMEWFLLWKSGLEVRVFGVGERLFTHAWAPEARYGFYKIEALGKSYINLTAFAENSSLNDEMAILHEFKQESAGRPFRIQPGSLPELEGAPEVNREIIFYNEGEKHSLIVRLNRTHVDMMDAYPYTDMKAYFEVDLSVSAKQSLFPTLKKMLEGKSDQEAVEFLLSFTRTSFSYKHDRLEYGFEKPMTAEQTLFYSVSDCEDRSALFYYLVRELLNLPVIVLDFENHVGAAVDLGHDKGQVFRHKDRTFVYCEPTGPQDELKIGEMWEKIKGQKFRILTEYIPD